MLTVKLGEIVHQVRVGDLLLQQVLLVQEEDDRGILEPGVGDDGPEQSFALLHTVLVQGADHTELKLCSFLSPAQMLSVSVPRCPTPPGPGRTRLAPRGT